jgi:hypothetical protein
VKRRSVARYLARVVVNRNPETFVSIAARLGLEDQIIPNDAQRFKIGRASGAILLLFKPALFLCGIGAGCGAILCLGHGASKQIGWD